MSLDYKLKTLQENKAFSLIQKENLSEFLAAYSEQENKFSEYSWIISQKQFDLLTKQKDLVLPEQELLGSVVKSSKTLRKIHQHSNLMNQSFAVKHVEIPFHVAKKVYSSYGGLQIIKNRLNFYQFDTFTMY